MGEFSSFQPLKTWIADRKSKISKMDKIGSEKVTPKPKVSKRTNKTKADYYFKCAFCPAELDDDAKLKIHIESKHLEDLFKFPCETCGFDAEGPRVLREHIAKVHGGKNGQTTKVEQIQKDVTSNLPISKVKKDVEVSSKPKQPQVENKDVPGEYVLDVIETSEVKTELDLAVNEETTIDKIVNDDASTKK